MKRLLPLVFIFLLGGPVLAQPALRGEVASESFTSLNNKGTDYWIARDFKHAEECFRKARSAAHGDHHKEDVADSNLWECMKADPDGQKEFNKALSHPQRERSYQEQQPMAAPQTVYLPQPYPVLAQPCGSCLTQQHWNDLDTMGKQQSFATSTLWSSQTFADMEQRQQLEAAKQARLDAVNHYRDEQDAQRRHEFEMKTYGTGLYSRM